MSRFLKQTYQELEAYVPGEQPRDMVYIKLNTNESPFPPAPQVAEAMTKEQVDLLRLYSDPTCKVLKEKLANLYGIKTENIYVGNGSDEAAYDDSYCVEANVNHWLRLKNEVLRF